MRKILLISDTHGDLDAINILVEKVSADSCIHAGDFGFYDKDSVWRLSSHELFLLISHSKFWKNYSVTKTTDKKDLIKIVEKHQLLGDFPAYLAGHKQLSVPTYAIWGNHEDAEVIKALKKDNPVHNLNLLDSDRHYELSDAAGEALTLYGLGGNFLPSKKLLRTPIAGQGGKVWMTLHEIGALYKKVKKKSKPSIFVSHVSPGKEPLLTRIMTHFMPNLWISGHMGAPYTCTWNQFTIRNMDESLAWFDVDTSQLDQDIKTINLSEEAQLGYELLKRPVPRKDYWFKHIWNINLPDLKNGYAILEYHEGKASLHTYSLPKAWVSVNSV